MFSIHDCHDSKKSKKHNRLRDDDVYHDVEEEEKENENVVEDDDDGIFIETSNENLTDDMHLIANELLTEELNELNLCPKHRKLKCLFKNYELLRKNSQRSKLNVRMYKKRKSKSSAKSTNSSSSSSSKNEQSMLSKIIKKINCFSFVE
jgi:hypothetical protein